MSSVIQNCKGIRILKREAIDTIFEFIISANNNIKRIKKIVQLLCEKVGENKGEYFAFPTLKQLSSQSLELFNSLGAGYRGAYLFDTAKRIENVDIESLKKLDTSELYKVLLSLKGVGEKVANCILLFGFYRLEKFPVDTWMFKVYKEYFNGKGDSPSIATEFFEHKFGNLSGIAQQYLFYAKREGLIK